MPFIRGRYHINPIAGESLEAAREAETALLALHQQEQNGQDSENGDSSATAAKTPIHRVEIETAEIVPAHSGRSQRGFVVRILRSGQGGPPQRSHQSVDHAFEDWSIPSRSSFAGISKPRGEAAGAPQEPETHTFADHQDLVDFLRNEFARDCQR